MKKIFLLFFALSLISCGNKKVDYDYPQNPDYLRKSRAQNAFSKGDFVVYGKKNDEKKPANFAENSNANNVEKSSLWQASIEVIGALFPIAILDSSSKIITTEWYQESSSSNERIKINALIKGLQAKAENLQITIFRQKRSGKNGEIWQDLSRENSDSGNLSAKLLQEKILEKAQQK